MKRAILVICGMIIGIIIGGILVYYFMNNYNGNGRILELEQNNYISPDQAIIEVVDTIYENEYTNLKITMMKNGSKMNQYNSPIEIKITDENGTELTTNECAIPGNGFYKFADSDLGSKMFQKGLTIKKEGSFYIEVLDMLDPDEKILGRQKVNVIKNDILKNNDYYIDIITPEPGLQYTKGIIDIIAITPEHPNSPAQIYIDGGLPIMLDTDFMGQMYRTIWNIPTGEHTLYIKMVDRDGSIIGESDKIIFYMENK